MVVEVMDGSPNVIFVFTAYLAQVIHYADLRQ
jgi:hypothetical protein